jgi:hypothetical protein
MAQVNEELPYERLVSRLGKALAETGSIMAWADEIQVPSEQWRKAARAAAGGIGRRIRTLDSGSVLFAWLPDWPATDEEREIADRRLQEAARMIPSLFEPRTVSLHVSE